MWKVFLEEPQQLFNWCQDEGMILKEQQVMFENVQNLMEEGEEHQKKTDTKKKLLDVQLCTWKLKSSSKLFNIKKMKANCHKKQQRLQPINVSFLQQFQRKLCVLSLSSKKHLLYLNNIWRNLNKKLVLIEE